MQTSAVDAPNPHLEIDQIPCVFDVRRGQFFLSRRNQTFENAVKRGGKIVNGSHDRPLFMASAEPRRRFRFSTYTYAEIL
jgi:hypothetical protein